MEFVTTTLARFGYKFRDATPGTLYDELARNLRQSRSLLVLDGLETLQTPGSGAFMDQDLGRFLREIAKEGLGGHGFVLISSRESLIELLQDAGNSYRELKLGALDRGNGAELLRRLGVRADEKQLQHASAAEDGNPLQLVRLAGHWERLQPEDWDFLHLLGLFGRSMVPDDLDALLTGAARLTQRFQNFNKDQWKGVFEHLVQAHLLTGDPQPGPDWKEWDTHPLWRESFAREVLEQNPGDWEDAHRVLFRHYRRKARRAARRVEELFGLFGVVAHGCLAKQYTDALKFYRSRIAQEFRGFDTEKARAVQETLTNLKAFFVDRDVEQDPVAELKGENDRAWLLARMSYCYESLGKLRSAEAIRDRSNRLFESLHERAAEVSQEALDTARDTAFGLENLAEIRLRLAKLELAEVTAREAVKWAERTRECEDKLKMAGRYKEPVVRPGAPQPVAPWVRQCSTWSVLGSVLHRRGKLDEAAREFEKAFTLHTENEPGTPFHSESGFRYCMLRLDTAQSRVYQEELLKETRRMLDWSDTTSSSDTVAGLHCLTSGMTLAAMGERRAGDRLDRAEALLRSSHKMPFLCEALLARATFERRVRPVEAARRLTEVLSISGASGMRLSQADAYLLSGHLALDRYDLTAANEALIQAHNTIGPQFGQDHYALREPELYLLAARLAHHQRDKVRARLALEACVQSVQRRGESLRREWQRYESGEWEFTNAQTV
jgi:tetratricopeptide (TPR) repeat protein